jgi:hypothetical protein
MVNIGAPGNARDNSKLRLESELFQEGHFINRLLAMSLTGIDPRLLI